MDAMAGYSARTSALFAKHNITSIASQDVVVIDDALTPAETAALRRAMDETSPQLAKTHQVLRGDSVAWVDERGVTYAPPTQAPAPEHEGNFSRFEWPPAPPPLSAASVAALDCAVSLLKGVPAALGGRGSNGVALRPPAECMAAKYPAGGTGYHAHVDNVPLKHPRDRNDIDREVTAVLYANDAEWDADAGGGALRCHPTTAPGRPLDVAPKGGRLVLFSSRDLLHEVLAVKGAHTRYAITCWVLGHRGSERAAPPPLRLPLPLPPPERYPLPDGDDAAPPNVAASFRVRHAHNAAADAAAADAAPPPNGAVSAAGAATARAALRAMPGYAPSPLVEASPQAAAALGLGAVSFKLEGKRAFLGKSRAVTMSPWCRRRRQLRLTPPRPAPPH